ncbi:MAG: hypothetical protein CK431_04360 [Mycobacterium sp.]|nr:MAG: hypothetical protein CK431_04360 [Mycobacterium sp.]
MADTEVETTTENENPEATTESQEKDEALGGGGKKALDAERAARKAAEKTANELAAKVKAFEDRDKTDAEKSATRIAELEKALADKDSVIATKELERLRTKIASREGKQVPVESLTGTTEEELIAQADRLLEWRGTAKQSAASLRQTGMRSGAAAPPDGSSNKEKAAAALRALRAGN